MLSAEAATKQKSSAPTAPKKGVDLTHRDLSWFSQRVEKGRQGLYSEIVTITPDIARRLLEMNHDNRRLNERTIRDVARDIANGRWKLNGETIIISTDGELNDGQNRLSAVVRADKPIQSIVVFGADRKSRETVDMGRSRSPAQFLGMRGIANSLRLSSAARLQLSFLDKKGERADNYTKQDVIQAFTDWQEQLMGAFAAIGHSKFVTARMRNGTFLIVAYANIKAADSLNCELFFEKLCGGYSLEEDDPIFKLRERLLSAMTSKDKFRNESLLELTIRYWNAWAQGKEVIGSLRLTGVIPEILTAERKV